MVKDRGIFMIKPSGKLWLLIAVIIALLLGGGSYYYTKVAQKPFFSKKGTITPKSSVQSASGIRTAQEYANNYPQLVKQTFIQQQIQGTLTMINDNNWTIEAGGRSLTLSNQGANKVYITKLPKVASGSAQKVVSPTEIKPQDLKVGNEVVINLLIDWQTGKVTIVGITVLPQ